MRNLKKLIALSLLTLLIGSSFQPMVMAGVVKELVEVDPQQREIEIQEETAKKEEYRKEALEKKQEEAVEKAKEIIEKQVPPPPPPAPKPVSPKKATKGKYSNCFICKPIAMLTGAVVGPVVGLARGTLSKGMKHAGDYKEFMGDGVIGTTIGAPMGALTGGVLGAVTGLANGLATGIVKGATNPFSAENYSTVEGDYDPYKFLVGGLD